MNNTPIKEAIDADPDVDVVYVIASDPANMEIPSAEAAKLGGVHLGLRLAEMLIDERLGRDLSEAKAVNDWLDVLDWLQREPRLASRVLGVDRAACIDRIRAGGYESFAGEMACAGRYVLRR